jgi:DNA-directed RNA polymerase specialized sigma24 family protein
MSISDNTTPEDRRHPARFHTTRWSVIQAAAGEDSAVARDALATLCENYWYPVYAFVRRSGCDPDESRDLTQGFFARLLEKRDIGSADPVRGRFRGFLLGSVRHFLSNERDRARALKRGGGQSPLSIDQTDAEGRYVIEPADPATPETLFMRHWALTVIDASMLRLAEEYAEHGKQEIFEKLRPALTGADTGTPRSEMAAELGMSETALNVVLHRMRRRFRHKLKEEVAQTLADPGDTDDELGHLMAAL